MTQFLRIFPGEEKRGFREVSEKQWDEPIFQPDQNGWGCINQLTTDIRVYDKRGGNLKVAKKWPSKSYTRNFARIVRMMFTFTNRNLTDETGAFFDTQMITNGNNPGAVIPDADFVLQQTGGGTGAAMAIGRGATGTSAEIHTRSEMVDLIAREDASRSVFDATIDTTTYSFTIMAAFEITAAASETITEVGLLSHIRDKDDTNSSNVPPGNHVLLAYDVVTDTVVTQGGIITPRYTLEFPV